MTDTKQSPDEFRQFSLAVYGMRNVSQSCLWLQDECGVDVNFLLFVLFCGHRGYALSPADIERLEEYLGPWRQNVVHPIRRVRRWMKQQATYIDVESTRQSLLACEIKCEQRQQQMMESALSVPHGAPSAQIAAANVSRYLASCDVPRSTHVVEHLATLLSEVFPPLSAAEAKSLLAAPPPT